MTTASNKPDFPVVGIGASAGGLDALRTLFAHMPDAPGFACVVVVHLSPEHESHLGQLLQPHTRMPVSQVVTTTALEPNRVYVIPPNANLNSIDTHLRLSELEARRFNRAPIDHFLRTLAATHGASAVGVILSGSGSDGALGVRQIREQGGLTIAQLPREADYASMPQSAIATGAIDLVLPLERMPGEITAYCGSTARLPFSPDAAPSDEDLALLEKIIAAVRGSTGCEIAMYRRGFLLQRAQRRMRLRHVAGLADYFELLHVETGEAAALQNELSLNVTEFFRDGPAYEALERVIGEILDRKLPAHEAIRVWCIGCSTGEEAYSVAMLLVEQASRRGNSTRLQVFATELSPDSLQRAREGVYPAEIAGAMSRERLERFFTHDGGRYRARSDLRGIVTFSSHNLFQDPPYAHLDLIVCRNLLRDLEPEIGKGALSLFHYALDSSGVLIVDPDDEAEAPDLFERNRANPRLLLRRDGPRRLWNLPPELRPFRPIAPVADRRVRGLDRLDTARLFYSAIERYAPSCVLINAENHVVHFSSTAARYVRMPGGELTLDVLSLVAPAIGYQLNSGLEALKGGARTWQSEPFFVAAQGAVRHVVLRIDSVGPASAGEAEHRLVVFDEMAEASGRSAGAADDATRAAAQDAKSGEVPRLKSELAQVHEQLAAVSGSIAAAVTHRQELQRQRGEQLRATVEELENTREELQAVNEELKSFLDENHYRVAALSQLSGDLKHLLESTGLATLLVDTSLNIVRFTPLAADIFHLKSTDVGRPISDMKHELRYAHLIEDARRVLASLTELELEVESLDGRWFLVRMQPYRSALQGLEGVVVVLLDVTSRKLAELALREADRRKDEFLAMLAHELRNPLAAIRSGVEVLRKASNDASVVERVSPAMARQTQQLVRLVDDLLEVGRINTGKLALRIAPARVADVVRDAIVAVRPLIESARHELTTFVPEDPLVVDGDAARLTQVVANLLNNAARYTPSGGQIAITAHRAEGNVVIRVKDSGRGISPQALPRLFDLYYQESAPDRERGAGLGIGLTLAKKLVEMHSGSIDAESAGPNCGSTFTVRLPLADGPEESPSDLERGAGGSEHEHRILVVDDNMDAAESLSLLLSSIGGGEVKTAFSGEEALTLGARLCPDIVLLDLGMPHMDGYEVARRIRREPWGKDTLLVALTGWGQEQYRNRTREAGFDRHLTKPAEIEALRAVLNQERVH